MLILIIVLDFKFMIYVTYLYIFKVYFNKNYILSHDKPPKRGIIILKKYIIKLYIIHSGLNLPPPKHTAVEVKDDKGQTSLLSGNFLLGKLHLYICEHTGYSDKKSTLLLRILKFNCLIIIF